MSASVVSVDSLAKVYRVYPTPWDRLREALTRRSRHRDFHALEGVSFDLARGEGLAVVGENGAGKSTLLKILAGITAPTSGQLGVRGKIASILELGSGFHPEFTGRQNIVLNAAMLGLGEAEVRAKMPDIVAFSELGEFIDQPVKCYSTGMAMRLGFSIATQIEPDVLIIDEALSVGDGYFQKKCMDRLQRFVAGGGTLLFCSHAMYYVSAFCRRALWLKGGRPEALGPVDEVVRRYENYLVAKSARRPAQTAVAAGEPVDARAAAHGAPAEAAEAGTPEAAEAANAADAAGAAASAAGRRPARLLEVRAAGRELGAGLPPATISCGDPLTLEIAWECDRLDRSFHAGVGINRADGVEVCAFSTHLDGWTPLRGETYYRVSLTLPRLPLVKGEFTLYVFVLDEHGLHVYDQAVYADAFTVASPTYRFGLIEAEHVWRREPAPALAAAAMETR